MSPTNGSDVAQRPGRWRRAALAVFAREMRETLRDRRTLLAAVLLPVVTMPLMVLVAPALLHRQQQALRERPSRVAVEDEASLVLAEAWVRSGRARLVRPEDPRGALLAGRVDVVLAHDRSRALLVVLYDESRPASAAAARAAAALRGAAPGPAAAPFSVELRNLAVPERMGGALLASALPLFLIVWILLGGQHAALDVGVGERERGTLEPLLAMPASRSALAAGKFLAVLAPSVAALAMTLASGVAALALGGGMLGSGEIRVALAPAVVLWLLLVGAALAGLLSAVQLAVSLGAGTLRQAQQAFTALYLAVAFPSLLLPLAGEVLDRPWVPLVPVINAVAAIRGLLGGDLDPLRLGLVAGVLVVLTLPPLALAASLLDRHRSWIRQ